MRRSLIVSEKTTEELSKYTNLSYDYLRNKVLPHPCAKARIFKVGTRGKGSAIVWGLNSPDDAATSATLPRGCKDCSVRKVVSDPKGLHDLADEISSNTVVALDLETMPPPGWIWEVAAEYRAWRKKLKNKPKPTRRQAVGQIQGQGLQEARHQHRRIHTAGDVPRHAWQKSRSIWPIYSDCTRECCWMSLKTKPW